MSLESAMAALTAALEANTAALSGIKGAAKAAVEAKGATAAAKPAAAAKPKTKAATEEDLRSAFGGYMSVKDKAERAERTTKVQKILEHMEVAKATDLDPSRYAEAIGYVNLLVAGEALPFDEEDADGEDGDDALI